MQTNFVSLIIGLLFALNTVLIEFHTYHFSNTQLDALDKLISALGMVLGVVLSHKDSIKVQLKELLQLFSK